MKSRDVLQIMKKRRVFNFPESTSRVCGHTNITLLSLFREVSLRPTKRLSLVFLQSTESKIPEVIVAAGMGTDLRDTPKPRFGTMRTTSKADSRIEVFKVLIVSLSNGVGKRSLMRLQSLLLGCPMCTHHSMDDNTCGRK